MIRLSTRAVLCIFSFATLTVQAHAQVTSQINVTSRSLVVEPATNDYAAPGGVTTFLTTYDGWDGLPLYPFSGEVRPLYLGSTEYVTDYEGHLGIMDPSTTLLNYGELVISNMPVAADSDGDGLPNFLEVNLASSFSVDAADREDYRFDGNTNNSEWTLSFARAAGSSQGNYTLKKKSDPNNPEKIWNGNYHLKGATGSLVFNTNNKTFSFTIDSYDRVYPETNHATGAYGITQTGQLLMHGFWMESSLGTNQKKYINPFLAQRIASGDRGRAVLYSSDGHPYNPSDPSTTPYPDYTEFHLELTNFPASITQTPTALSPLPWNDEFTSSNSSANYLDFRNSHFAGLEVSGGKLNLTASANQYGDAYGNLSIYSPPHLLLPLSASWDISVQVSLPEPDGAYYKGVGVSLTPENETYDIANFGATVYSFELGQDNDPATPGTFLATHARRDWMPDSNLSQVTSVNFNTTYLRFAYDASTKILSSYYDSNVSSPTRSWSLYQELDLDPTDPNSVASNLGLTSSSHIRMALWADAFVTNAIATNQIWMDSLSITQKQIEGIFSFHYPTARSTYGSDSYGDKIVGYYESDPDSLGNTEKHGFLLQNGNWTTLQPPGSTRSEARGISSNGTIVGYLRDSTGKDRGYVYKNGAFTAQDYPAASKTRIIGIDASDDTRWVGYFTDSSGITRGFIKTAAGWTSLNYPEASESRAYAIAGSNVIGKYRLNADGPEYGFLWNGSSWTNLGEGRLPYAVTSDGYVIGENSGQASVSQSATYFVYKSGSFRNVLLTGTAAAIPYGFDPSTSTVTGFYLQEDQSGWNGFTQAISFTSLPIHPPALTNGIRAYLDQAFVYTPVWSNAVSFSATGLPPSLNNNSSSGAISGTPSQAGYFRAIQTAHNGTNSTDFTIPITILGMPLSLPFSDDFSIEVPNRYMPLNLGLPAALLVTGDALQYVCTASDSDGALAAWIPNLPLPLTNSWDVVVDAKMPAGWNTPYAGLGLTLMPYEESGTIESTAQQRRLNLKLGRDTDDPNHAGNYFARAAYTNNEEYVFPTSNAPLPYLTTNTPATRATLRLSFHGPSKTLSTWYRTNESNVWEQLGTPYDLNPSSAGSLGHSWGLSNNSTLRVALWGDSWSANGSAGQPMELDNLAVTIPSGLIYPSLPQALSRRPGEPIFLSASPRDVGSYTYEWKKDGNLLPVGRLGSHRSTYYLGNPSPDDNGTYSLIISRNGHSYGTNSTILTISNNAPAGPRSDNFEADLGRWNGVWGHGAHDGYLKLGSGRLQAISDKAGSENTQAFYLWDHRLPTDQSWEVTVDASMAANIPAPITEDYFYHSLRLKAEIPVHLTNLWFFADSFGVNFAEDKDGAGNRRRTVQTVLSSTTSGWAELLPINLPLNQTMVSLRLRYESSNKTLTSSYRSSSSADWQETGSSNFDSLPTAQLQNGFRLHLSSIAEPSFVISEGQAYFDNFTLKYDLSLSNAAVTTKSFDGAPNATITGTLIGVAPGDSVSHNGAGLFDSPAKGANKPVTANLALTGTESAHYTITQPIGLTGTIQSLSEIFFGNLDPTNVASDGLTYLMKYAYGAADPTNPISQSLRPVTTLTNNGSGQPVLALTYFVRTNDTNLLIQPIWSSELTSSTSSWQSNVTVNTLGVTNTNGLVLEQRKATVPIDSTAKKFLRLKATLNK